MCNCKRMNRLDRFPYPRTSGRGRSSSSPRFEVGGFAADPPTVSGTFMDDSSSQLGSAGSTSQLVQAMAGFGGGSSAFESLSAVALGAETSQQPLLTTPQHA